VPKECTDEIRALTEYKAGDQVGLAEINGGFLNIDPDSTDADDGKHFKTKQQSRH